MAEPERLTPSQIDRLGDRLRASAEVSEADLALLQEYQGEHAAALLTVQSEIDRVLPGALQTSRVKTVGTLVDKLRRQKTKLSRVHDIAGVRVVIDGDRVEQDSVVATLLAAFPGSDVIDRRQRPSYGYRAVHVIVRVDRCWVEVQVRTGLQHSWAEMVERLGDMWGRQIRYGGLPDDPDEPMADDITPRRLWTAVMALGDALADLEAAIEGRIRRAELGQTVSADPPPEADALRERFADLGRMLLVVASDEPRV